MRHFLCYIMLCSLFNTLCIVKATRNEPPNSAKPYEAIYQFGDSLSDTGNLIRVPSEAKSCYKKLPYGQTFRPTGRASNGLLMVDYIAQYFNLPLLNPYLASGSDFSHGVNFAVAGATANGGAHCLATQLSWFKTHLKATFSNPRAIKERLQKSLVLMGEIGGNDFNGLFFQRKPIAEAAKLVPGVIKTIKDAVNEVISLGATNIVVPGNFPLGCVPIYLFQFATKDTSKYDEHHCLKDYNDFSKSYNQKLIEAIQQLQKEHPNVAIVYGDYYSAVISVITNAPKLGIQQDDTRKACCGTGNNPYNYGEKFCGDGAPVCPDPSKRINWDGVHMTQYGYKCVSEVLLKHFVPELQKHKI